MELKFSEVTNAPKNIILGDKELKVRQLKLEELFSLEDISSHQKSPLTLVHRLLEEIILAGKGD